MAYKFGMLTNQDASDRVLINTIGQNVVYEDIGMFMAQRREDMARAMSVFVEMTTDLYTERYKLPGGGRLQKRGRNSNVGAVKASGYWDVAYPLDDFGAGLAFNDVDIAYMTVAEINRHVNTIITQDENTVRYEILRRLFKNTTDTFVDPFFGSLTIQPAANGDAVLYPPVLGSEDEATDDHYLESNYASASISNTNNPVLTMVEELNEHFGDRTGGENIAVFINGAQETVLRNLSDFVPVPDNYVRSGALADVPQNLPNVPGKVIGRLSGAWVIKWRWIPANYLLGNHLEAPAPLKMRVDAADTGLGSGLQLVANDQRFPLQQSTWRHRFGVGCGNRLNTVVMELGTGGTYSIPSAYS